ncbi:MULTISPECIES: DUF6228 family protein [Actinosynnema]|uniref:DUF6228 family protein n=1 Tax=Actinosynnema TaxID=40566 RepID=UPI0020A5FB7A|nr:DUF6228 family protein [Actinosynnema pretiosum]MCP2099071.1 hypothetical protein [Actinosynnema pretiosum]
MGRPESGAVGPVVDLGAVLLWNPGGADPEHPLPKVAVRLRAEGMTALLPEAVAVNRDGPSLPDFLAGLAESFAGWEGERRWESLDRDLLLTATHDGRGAVALRWEVAPWRGPGTGWRASVVVAVEPGEGMRGLAEDVREVLAG